MQSVVQIGSASPRAPTLATLEYFCNLANRQDGAPVQRTAAEDIALVPYFSLGGFAPGSETLAKDAAPDWRPRPSMEKRFVRSPDGCRYAYARFGSEEGNPPLLLLSHFRASIDMWDPALLQRLAADRTLIVVDNRGIGLSDGTTPRTVEAMAGGIAEFMASLGLGGVDVLGFSLGGYVAQALARIRPNLVRRLILAGTAPRGFGEDNAAGGRVRSIISKELISPKDIIHLFFPPTAVGRAHGIEYIRRLSRRQVSPAGDVTETSWRAQMVAAEVWGARDPLAAAELTAITQPTFVAHGELDIMVAAEKSSILASHVPDSVLKIYPGTGHGFLFQTFEEFGTDVVRFLADESYQHAVLPDWEMK
ncbi:alpha/beta fold hydrolase [Streptomyces sp. NPDC001843]|uniref:alpha/beta fold hydrolase n=1 Tax=Streptomyces sp. NPDC001843 TaxID=3364617 RepID=UPI0036C39582